MLAEPEKWPRSLRLEAKPTAEDCARLAVAEQRACELIDQLRLDPATLPSTSNDEAAWQAANKALKERVLASFEGITQNFDEWGWIEAAREALQHVRNDMRIAEQTARVRQLALACDPPPTLAERVAALETLVIKVPLEIGAVGAASEELDWLAKRADLASAAERTAARVSVMRARPNEVAAAAAPIAPPC